MYSNYPIWQLDYVRVGRHFVQWLYPPKFEKEAVFVGADGLEMADTKLWELLERQRVVREGFRKNVQYIKSKALKEGWDQFSIDFWLYLESAKATELAYIKKWMYYWIKISNAINEKLGRKLVGQEREGKITDLDIEQAKEYPLTELYDGQLTHTYNRHKGLCPFHDEKTPSFVIFENNHFHCFGCQAHGTSIDYVMKTRNISFIEAVKELSRL